MEYQAIDLKEYILAGEGGTALTYVHKDGHTLAKLYMPGYGAELARREFLVSRTVYQTGIPTPEPIRLVTDGERFGAEYELIAHKRSFTRIISEEPGQLEPLSRLFARLSRSLHATEAPLTQLPDMRELVRSCFSHYEALPPDVESLLRQALDAVPEVRTCLHGDLHIGNIITDGQRNLWIDVGDFAYGAPEWDLAMLYYSSTHLSQERSQQIFHLDPPVMAQHWDLFARAYWQIDSQEEVAARLRELRPYIALKLFYVVSKLSDGKAPLREQVAAMIRSLLV